MKKALKLTLILLIVCISLVSCSANGSTETSSEVSGSSAITSLAEDTVMLDVASSGKFNFKIIRADEANSAVERIAINLKNNLSERLGTLVEIGNDFVYVKAPLDPESPEILVGETNREESTSLVKELEKAGQNRFGIYSSKYKIAICGTSEYMTYLGVSYFIKNYVYGSGSNMTITVPSDLLYISEEQKNSIPDFEEARKNGVTLEFYSLENVATIKTVGNYTVLQGGGYDGKYAYYSIIDKSTNCAIIYKYDIETWKLVKTSEPLPTGHSNDIAYDAKNNRLVISYCLADDSYTGVCTVDAETLQFITYTQTKFAQRAVEYIPETDQYLFGTNYFYTLTDNQFAQIRTFNDITPKYTTQGMCCDSTYVYDVRWESTEDVQHIIVHNFLNGKGYGEFAFYGATGEPENIFRCGDVFYVACNKSLAVQKLILMPASFE